MNLGIARKRAVVTGASQGIGRAIALGLAREGCSVTILSRREDKLAEVLKEMEMEGENQGHSFFAADLMEEGVPTQVAKELLKQLGVIDIVIHNVGGTLQTKDPLAPVENWQRVWQFNAGIAIEINAVLVPSMVARRWGRVVHISSISAESVRGSVPYAASKAFLNAYVKGLARAVAKEGVVVSGVMPGAIISEGGHWNDIAQTNPAMMKDFIHHHMAIGRLGTAEEIAPLVVFLSSQLVTFAAGAVMPVDGGSM